MFIYKIVYHFKNGFLYSPPPPPPHTHTHHKFFLALLVNKIRLPLRAWLVSPYSSFGFYCELSLLFQSHLTKFIVLYFSIQYKLIVLLLLLVSAFINNSESHTRSILEYFRYHLLDRSLKIFMCYWNNKHAELFTIIHMSRYVRSKV